MTPEQKNRRNFLFSAAAVVGSLTVPSIAEAKSRHHMKVRKKRGRRQTVEPTKIQDHASVAVDAKTGKILIGDCAQDPRIPASLTKLMTLYLAFDAMRNGDFKLDDQLFVSRRAAFAAASGEMMLHARAGTSVDARTVLLAINIESDCDMCRVVAEKLSGTEKAFTDKMNKKAEELGMMQTHFADSSGASSLSITTAYDMALLLAALHRDFPQPQYAELLTVKQFEFKGRTVFRHDEVMYGEHNRGERDPNILISKTGFIKKAGLNEATLATDGGQIVCAVVMGELNHGQRRNEILSLIQNGFKKSWCNAGDFFGLPMRKDFNCPAPILTFVS